MAADDIATNLGVLTERVTSVQDDIKEIKAVVDCSEKRGVAFEKHYIAEHARIMHKADAAHKRIDNHDNRIADISTQLLILTKSIQPLIATNKVLGWLGGVLGASILVLIWMIIIGQVTLNFP